LTFCPFNPFHDRKENYPWPPTKKLQAQFEALTEQAEAARLAELQAVIDDVRAKVAEYWPDRKGRIWSGATRFNLDRQDRRRR
jgi:hypothetical protein